MNHDFVGANRRGGGGGGLLPLRPRRKQTFFHSGSHLNVATVGRRRKGEAETGTGREADFFLCPLPSLSLLPPLLLDGKRALFTPSGL